MFDYWYTRINTEANSIMIVTNRNCWNQAIEYRSIGQTQSAQTDINPEGTDKSRKLAKKLLSIGDVRGVKFWRDTVFITINKETSKKEAEHISMRAMETLASHNLYGYWRTLGR